MSVVVPAYQAAAFLEGAVESVFAQTWQDWDLLIVDDGSSDNTLMLAERAKTRDPKRVQVLRHPGGANRGVSASRNLALDHALGPLIAFLDADDEWLPCKLERQLEAMTDQAVELAWARAMYIDEHSRPTTIGVRQARALGHGPTSAARCYDAFLQRDISIPTLTVVARLATLRRIGGFPEGMRAQTEDHVTWARILRCGMGVFIDEVVARYRVHASSWTGRLSSLAESDADMEALECLLSSDGADSSLSLAILREGRKTLAKRDIPLRLRLQRFGGVLRTLKSAGALGPGLLASAVRRRLRRNPS